MRIDASKTNVEKVVNDPIKPAPTADTNLEDRLLARAIYVVTNASKKQPDKFTANVASGKCPASINTSKPYRDKAPSIPKMTK